MTCEPDPVRALRVAALRDARSSLRLAALLLEFLDADVAAQTKTAPDGPGAVIVPFPHDKTSTHCSPAPLTATS
jgi:hypothetical protein